MNMLVMIVILPPPWKITKARPSPVRISQASSPPSTRLRSQSDKVNNRTTHRRCTILSKPLHKATTMMKNESRQVPSEPLHEASGAMGLVNTAGDTYLSKVAMTQAVGGAEQVRNSTLPAPGKLPSAGGWREARSNDVVMMMGDEDRKENVHTYLNAANAEALRDMFVVVVAAVAGRGGVWMNAADGQTVMDVS